METTTMKKTKSEQLTEMIASRRRELAKLEAELQPRIVAGRAELEKLRNERDAADRASANSYRKAEQAARDAEARLFTPGKYAELRAKLVAFVTDRGLPGADVDNLTRDVVGRAVAADPEVIAARIRRDEDLARERRAARAVNLHAYVGSPLYRMESKLNDARALVEELERELMALPARRAAARIRRQEQKDEERRDADTAAARALVAAEFKLE